MGSLAVKWEWVVMAEPYEAARGSLPEVRFETHGALALITLNRQEALNALTHAMCVAIDRSLAAWASDRAIAAVVIRSAGDRAFCAGGDVRALYDAGIALNRGQPEGRVARIFIRDEYRMNRRIRSFPKPYIALIDGVIMGGGLGVSVHGSHRVATERTLFAMPETAIGLFPDAGGSYVLPRLPGETGCYLGLTGARIKAPDMVALGLATRHVPSAQLSNLLADLVRADWSGDGHRVADAVIGSYATEPGEPELAQHRTSIERCFRYDGVAAMLAALDTECGAFAAEAAATIRKMSPTSLKLALASNRRGRHLEFDDCLVMEYRLIQSILRQHDFYEGVRAMLIDKDRKPKWDPPVLDAVDQAMLDRYFIAPPHGDLAFTD
jgi:enoyl-CoA hydratase